MDMDMAEDEDEDVDVSVNVVLEVELELEVEVDRVDSVHFFSVVDMDTFLCSLLCVYVPILCIGAS